MVPGPASSSPTFQSRLPHQSAQVPGSRSWARLPHTRAGIPRAWVGKKRGGARLTPVRIGRSPTFNHQQGNPPFRHCMSRLDFKQHWTRLLVWDGSFCTPSSRLLLARPHSLARRVCATTVGTTSHGGPTAGLGVFHAHQFLHRRRNGRRPPLSTSTDERPLPSCHIGAHAPPDLRLRPLAKIKEIAAPGIVGVCGSACRSPPGLP